MTDVSSHSVLTGCPRRPSAWTGDPAAVVGVTTIGADRLQPCVLELCSFFSQCLCGRFPHKTHLKRFQPQPFAPRTFWIASQVSFVFQVLCQRSHLVPETHSRGLPPGPQGFPLQE